MSPFQENISVWAAFIGGVISFFSPCMLPLIPAYIMYIAGVSDEKEASMRRALVLSRTLFFVMGFTLVFVALGLSAGAVGRIIATNKQLLEKISGIVLFVFGLNLMGLISIGFLSRYFRMSYQKSVSSSLGAFIMGVVFGAGWTPCFGYVIGSILVIAASSSSASHGAFLLFMYSVGMAIPFILGAMFIEAFATLLNKTQKYTENLLKVAGLVISITGVLMFFGLIGKIGGLFI